MKIRFIFLLILISNALHAQDMFGFLQGGNVPWTYLEFENLWEPKQALNKDLGKTDVIYRHFHLSQQVLKHEKFSFGLNARYQKLDLNKDIGILRDYYNIQFGGNFTYTMEDKRFWSLSYSYGSASDKPFDKNRDSVDNVNFVYKFSDRWFIVGNYSNNRTFLNGVPLPGVFYVKEMTREKTLIIGFPFIFWKTPIAQKMSFTLFTILPWNYRARVHYELNPFLRPYIGVEQMPQSYFRSDRENRKDRVFWIERRYGLGIEGNLSRHLKYDLSSGLTTDRRLYEAKNFTDKKKNLAHIQDGFYSSFTLRANF